MKILVYSHAFYPSVGGSESACRVMVDGLIAAGHEIHLISQTPGTGEHPFPYPITRQPNAWRLFQLLKWCDVYVHSNVSLRGAWPLLAHRKPWVVIHHSRITRLNGKLIWLDHLKRFMLRFATNISVSHSMAHSLPVQSTVLGNGYDDAIFKLRPEVARDRDIMFLGRLNYDKGAHVVIEALRILKAKGRPLTLTIVGAGGEQENLRRQASEADLAENITFAGKKEGKDIGLLLNRHRILVVPSLVAETFGLVIMEGLASGCGVIASDVGALKETVGPCGLIFPPGDPIALATELEKMLGQPALIAEHQTAALTHLIPFQRQNSLKAYLELIENAAQKRIPVAASAHVLFTPSTL